ncbi:SMP-30/gluconolactonase/LRE family protein [Gordonia sp. (in: high G+C Gram-positive bacteria)]|uniref:SMP-30/gluconolactonase/LRE family protein n=1 Tax=Gordonia sp. (in: high G+C Gram-positive bacteria) TaxID=84139 RepID=UPI003F9E482E
MRIRRSALVASAGVLFGLSVGSVPGLQEAAVGVAHADTCARALVDVKIPAATPVRSWAENVGFDADGDLWVSRVLENVIERYDAGGRLTGRVHVDSPGAVRLGPDGRMFATSGDTTVNMVPGLPLRGTVISFDPSVLERVRVEARGLGMPNGLAFDDMGAMYVADSNLGVVRVRRDGTIDRAWTARAPRNLAPDATVNGTGMNGMAIVDGNAYVGMTTSASGRILRVPLDDPADVSVVADVTAPLPGVVDDLTIVPGGRLAVARTTGQVVVVGKDGRRCTVGAGRPLTSLAVTPSGDSVVAGTEDGAVLEFSGRLFSASV